MTASPGEAIGDLPTLSRRAAARWGERQALVFDETGERLTFADIEARSNALSNALRGLGIGKGDKVAVMLRNRPEFPLGWLAITKAGAAMVPVNVFYKAHDAGYIIAHSEAKAAITAAEFLPLLNEIKNGDNALDTVISVDGGTGAIALDELSRGAETAPPGVAVAPEDLANIQYTSGTTGRPKGCLQSHRQVVEFGRVPAVEACRLTPEDTVLTAQPFYYVDPQWNFTACLYAGARLVVLDRFHPSSFWAKVREHEVTFFYCLAMMPRLLLQMPPGPEDRAHKVRLVVCSAIPPERHAELEARWGVPWLEAYGMTETGADIFVSLAEHDALVGTGCIGRPSSIREARIVDDEGGDLPPGQAGELVMRGPAMMDGYFKNPEATAEIFRGGWLHTGDLARMDEAGRIYFVGRKKDMIRRSGENISAAEVEDVLAGHAAVRMAACLPVPDPLRGEEVKAYVVLKAGETPATTTPQALAAYCRERLAYFKVPRYWAFPEDLPRTPSERVMKDVLKRASDDLRTGAYDVSDEVWR